MRILLAEDNELLGDGIRCSLTRYHYNVDWVKNGAAAWACLQTEHFDVLILDLDLPKISGEDVLKNLRRKNINIPVIILTAHGKVGDVVKGLDIGADDYIVKPLDLEELCARIRAIQRRTTFRTEPTITIGDITLDPAARIVFKNGKMVELSRREFILLQMLIENAGRVLKREQIAQSLYGWSDVDSNALEVHIHNLRKKFGNNTIVTIRGIGYLLDSSNRKKT